MYKYVFMWFQGRLSSCSSPSVKELKIVFLCLHQQRFFFSNYVSPYKQVIAVLGRSRSGRRFWSRPKRLAARQGLKNFVNTLWLCNDDFILLPLFFVVIDGRCKLKTNCYNESSMTDIPKYLENVDKMQF